MKMTNGEMLSCIELMQTLNETGKLGYAIARNTRKLSECATDYIEMRQAVFKEFGAVRENGRAEISVSIYEEKLKDIAEIELDVDVYQIDEETFFSGGLTSWQMEKLIWMVKEQK